MKALLLDPKPLSGAPLQFALLSPVLVLLVICFAVGTTGGHGKPIDFPFAPNAPFVSDADSDLSISVQRDGMIFIDAKWYPEAAFATKIRELGAQASSTHLVLRADRTLSFGAVRSILREVRAAGYTAVTLITFSGHTVELMSRLDA